MHFLGQILPSKTVLQMMQKKNLLVRAKVFVYTIDAAAICAVVFGVLFMALEFVERWRQVFPCGG